MKTWKGQANALCHRDYTTGTSVQVNVYMDFIEIMSPGLFPEGDSPDRHLEGSGGDSKQRNPNIAQVLFQIGHDRAVRHRHTAHQEGRATPLAWHSATARTSTQP